MATTLFPLWIILAALAGFYCPPLFSWFTDTYITWSLIFCMLGMGLTLTFDEILGVFTKMPQLLLLGMVRALGAAGVVCLPLGQKQDSGSSYWDPSSQDLYHARCRGQDHARGVVSSCCHSWGPTSGWAYTHLLATPLPHTTPTRPCIHTHLSSVWPAPHPSLARNRCCSTASCPASAGPSAATGASAAAWPLAWHW